VKTPWLAGMALALCPSCGLLGSGEESFEGPPSASSDRVPVVDDVGPFDPSEAVDDDDGSVVLADTDDPTDGGAFSDTAADGGSKTEAAENEAGDRELGTEAEPVADPAEVAAREEEQRREVEQVERSAGDEDVQKAELAENPPPEPVTESEPAWTKALDIALEVLIVAGAAALLSATLVFARSHPKTLAVASLGFGAIVWFLVSQLG
jgi:hypothetical protein